MTGRVQTLRSNVTGNRPPGGHLPGELYVNWPDGQLGVVNASSANQDLIPVTFFSTTANYSTGNFVVQAGQLYRATQAVSAGVFNASQWTQVGGSVSVGDTLPTNPQPGGLWWDSVGGQLYVYYNDGNTTQWVPATNLAGAATLTTSATPPVTPKAGDMWFDSVGGQLYIYFNDGSSLQWVIANNFNGGLYLPLSGGTLTGPLVAPGVIDGSNAAAGQVGEYLSYVSPAMNAGFGGWYGLGSLTLTPGDWDVWGLIDGSAAGSGVALTAAFGGLSTVNSVSPNLNFIQLHAVSSLVGWGMSFAIPAIRQNVTASSAIYLIVNWNGSSSSGTTNTIGHLYARRRR
jgi:hypothetical protein